MVNITMSLRILIIFYINSLLTSCALFQPARAPLNNKELGIASKLSFDANQLALLKAKPLYKFNENEIDLYLAYLQEIEPNVRQRVVHLGRKNIGQPYQIFLLGEFPFEVYDPEPLYCLEKSDCVVFCEHMYAMALAQNWPSFFAILQRIRYKNGEIGMLTRNHNTIPDWDHNNSWLIRDITEEIGGDLVKPMTVKTGKRRFFKKWNIGQDVPERVIHTSYIPAESMPQVLDKLENADFVNVIRGKGQPQWCGHVGLIAIASDGMVDFLHSTPPKVREEPLMAYTSRSLARNPERRAKQRSEFYGFKFFRLRQDALEHLKEIDGEAAPVVTGPLYSLKK